MSEEDKSDTSNADPAVVTVDSQTESIVDLKLKHAKELAELKVRHRFCCLISQLSRRFEPNFNGYCRINWTILGPK